MQAILVIGWKARNKPEGLYCGIDGNAAQAACNKARKSGKYIAIRKTVDFYHTATPVPCIPLPGETPEVSTDGK